MERLIEQIYSTDQDIECDRCRNTHGTFVSLSCEHKYCVICLTFIYAKHRHQDPNQGTVKCLKCQKITTLHPSHLDIVTKTLKQQVIPSIKNGENQLSVPKGIYDLHYTETINRKIKSEEHSFQHNITPSTTKCFFSKCQSPSSLKKANSKLNCSVHRGQPLTHLCFTCGMIPMCIKCSSSSKKHHNHDIKDIQKGMSIIAEQSSLIKMDISQKIQQIQLWERRFQDRNVIIKDRATKFLSEVRGSFQSISSKLEQKFQQVIQTCQKSFEQLLQKNTEQITIFHQSLQQLKSHYDKIINAQKDSENIDYILRWSQLKNQYKQINPINLQIEIDGKIRLPSHSLFRDIENVFNQIMKISVNFKSSSLSRIGNYDLQNCRSQSKLKKDYSKRLKTNFASLNSSRQKRKKYTKTEEDERRLRTQKVNFDIADKRNSKMPPAYVTDFINKKSHKYGTQCISYVLQMTAPNLQTSKMTSKLSKTIIPEDINKKKKDNMAIIKQRMERKTAQPSSKNRGQASRKKKIH